MKGNIIFLCILGVLVTIIIFIPGSNSPGASTNHEQKESTQKNVMNTADGGDAENNEHPPLDIIFVLDNSGSMKKNDPKFITKQVVTNFVNSIGKRFRLGMVIFGKKATLVEPLVGITTPEDASRFLNSLDRINYQGKFTNTPAGVERAVYELKTDGRETARKVIILLTDGIVDTGDKASDLEREKWLGDELTQVCRGENIRIFGIAFTDNADFRLIQTLASKTKGEYFRAYSAKDIPGVFKKVYEKITVPPVKIKPLTPDTPTPAPASASVETSAQKPATGLESPDDSKTVRKEITLIPLVVSGIAVLMGVIVLVITFKRKTKDRKTGVTNFDRPQNSLPPDHPVLKAELIDVNNIISGDSLSLVLNKISVSIGRDTGNNIVLPEDSISSLHATIEYKNGYFYLEDHRSTNGTSLNDVKLQENKPARLKSGDKIHFAVYEFRFLLRDQAPFGETVMLEKDKI